jgi:hypothetical protein
LLLCARRRCCKSRGGVATARDRRRMMWPWRVLRGELAMRRTVQWQRSGGVGAAPSGLLQAESAVDPVDTAAGLGVGCAVERSCVNGAC